MLTEGTYKTSWFHLSVVIIFTIIGLYFIGRALNKPFVEWQTVNQVRVSEIRSMTQ